ncbi:MAG: hypothetical protein ACXVJB_03785 [Mucilaginibacter sp.]
MKYFYTLLFIALPCIILAQSNYRAGYVIKTNGDTLKGFIDYHQWDQNPRSIYFKITRDKHQAINFDPRTIKEFHVSGETYVSYQGAISTDKNKFPDLPMGLDTGKRQDTIFLEQVSQGKYLTLFYHRDAIKARFFAAEKDAIPIELKYYQYSDQGQLAIKEFYRGQLLFYANKYVPGDPKLAQKIEDTRFDKTGLAEMISAINGESIHVNKESHYRFFLGGGLSEIKSNYRYDQPVAVYTLVGPVTEEDSHYEKVSKFSTTVSPLLDFGMDVFTNPDVQKLIYRTEVSFSYNSPKFQYVVAVLADKTNTVESYSFDQYFTTLTPQIILNLYNKNNFKIYIGGGIGFNFSVYTNEHLSKGTAGDLQSFWMNIPVQAGVVVNKRLELSLGYAGPADMVNFFNNSAGISNQHVSIGLRFLFNRP